MKHIALLFALILALAMPTFATSLPERLSKKQLDSLIASAKTPTEHQRIADYYRAESDRLLAEANDHAQMAASFRASADKRVNSNVDHCVYVAKTLKAKSAKALALAEDHERMAQAANPR